MRSVRVLVLALALALALPPSAEAAGKDVPAFPPELVTLAHKWIDQARALGANDTQRPWYPQAIGFLDNASAALAQGRVRTAMYDIETTTELTLAGQLADQAANLSSDAEKKQFVLEQATRWNGEAKQDWADYRARLHALEGDIHALQAMELALYSADEALQGASEYSSHDQLARDFPKTSGFQKDYVISLVRADHTAILDLQWANDILDLAGAREGLPPRLDNGNWSIMVGVALKDPGYGDRVPTQLQLLETIAKDVRAKNESIMAMELNLAEARADRAQNIEVIFGDAKTRGIDVIHDAAHGMNGQLNNTTMESATKYGLLGVFTADAVDRTVFTDEFVDRGQADLSFLIAAWSGLDYQAEATQTLAAASTIHPPPAVATKKTPAPGVDIIVLALGTAAMGLVVARRKR